MINIGVVGCGYWGINYVRIFSEVPNSKVVLVCDPDEKRLHLVRERYQLLDTTTSLDEIVSNKWLDAVVIATPASTHFSLAKQCLLAGKHVLVEKPLTTNVDDGEDLIEIAKQHCRLLMVGHTFLYNAGIRKMKDLISNESCGKIYYLHSTRTNMGPIRQDVNALWDLATHDIAIFNYLLDAYPQRATAMGSRVLGNVREDVGFISLSYPGHIIAHIHVSWVDPNKVREVVVVGSQRRIVFNDLDNLERVRIFEKGVSPSEMQADSFGEFRLLVRDGDIISPHIEASEPLKEMGTHFLECISTNRRPLTDGWNGLEVVRAFAAIDKSLSQNGSSVEVR